MTAPTVTPQQVPRVQTQSPPGYPVGRLLLGGLLILLGVGWLLEETGVVSFDWQTVLSVAVMAIGVALVATARSAHHGGLVFFGLVVSALLVATATLPGVSPFDGVGERSIAPLTLTELEPTYDLGMGPLTLDLSDVVVPPGEDVAVDASVGMGELSVRLPPDVNAMIEATAGAGDVTVLGRTHNGMGVEAVERVTGSEAAGRLHLTLSVGMGAIEVEQ
jgi:hypothetical protein